jgi:hypothetical protein
METRAFTTEQIEAALREREALRRALERIAQRVIDDIGDMPEGKHVPHNYATGTLLAIQGLAQAALEAA